MNTLLLQAVTIETPDLDFIKGFLHFALDSEEGKSEPKASVALLVRPIQPSSSRSFLPSNLQGREEKTFPIAVIQANYFGTPLDGTRPTWESSGVTTKQVLDSAFLAFDDFLSDHHVRWVSEFQRKFPYADYSTSEMMFGFRLDHGGVFHTDTYIISITRIHVPE